MTLTVALCVCITLRNTGTLFSELPWTRYQIWGCSPGRRVAVRGLKGGDFSVGMATLYMTPEHDYIKAILFSQLCAYKYMYHIPGKFLLSKTKNKNCVLLQ